MVELEPGPRVLGFLLGLGDLNRRVCHGYSRACVCAECLERVSNPKGPRAAARQPWEPRQAA